MTDYDYSIIEIKHRFKLDRALNDYKVTRFNKVIRTGYKHIFTSHADKVGKILFCIMYRDENFKLQYKEFDIAEWTITILHCTQFKIEF